MAKKATSKKMGKEKVIESFMTYALENDAFPKSVYKFCAELGIEESEFYAHFGSIDSLKKEVWNEFYRYTKSLLDKNKEYQQYSNRDKMLTFLFTFFELLTKNRSYVLFALNEHGGKLENLSQLSGLRKHVKTFATELIEDGNAEKETKIAKQSPKIFSEGAWLQVLFLMRFWMKDDSPAFEETDLAIEKSVRTIFEVFDTSILESLVDFGKFLYKSKMA